MWETHSGVLDTTAINNTYVGHKRTTLKVAVSILRSLSSLFFRGPGGVGSPQDTKLKHRKDKDESRREKSPNQTARSLSTKANLFQAQVCWCPV